ncbi:MAG TPA: class I SAM-dependent methyltransferase [Candidatus Dormibacteraeota bacterium]|jgi:SAM-dependent methyltransferase|nr:class I SAM-dependent methyltransferase [Candidatus Dormibacteraeota bacterium]
MATDSVDRVRAYYDVRGESEWHRLAAPFDGGIEWELHRRAFRDWLPRGADVLDVGGGPGRWTIWLAEHGHRVILGDLSPVQLEIARREIAACGVSVEDVVELDARDLSRYPDASFDAVLALGPFYHLLDAADRQAAAREALRVLRPGGRFFATVMTRYTWMLEVMMDGGSDRIDDVRRLLDDGTYRNHQPGRFTEAYLHRPEDVTPFFEAAGFTSLHRMSSQGMLLLVADKVAELAESDPPAWEALIEIAYASSSDPSISGIGGHLLYIGERS